MPVAFRRTLAIALLVAAGAACSKPNADEYAKKAEGYIADSRIPEAVIELKNALQADPRRGDLRMKLAELHVRQGELVLAREQYVRAADLMPNDLDAQVKAGGMLAMFRMFEEAQARAKRALEIDPKSADGQIILGNALAGLKQFPEAIAEYQQALVLDPTRDVAYGNIGIVQGTLGNKAEAEASFRKAVEVAPKSFSAHVALANFLLSTARVPEAEKTLKTALALDPTNVNANRALGGFYLMTKRAAEAEPYFQAIARTATTSDAKIGLADYYVIVNKYDEASKILQELARTPADYAAATIRLAAIDAAQGNRANAITRLKEVVEKHPKNMTARVLIARLQLGDQKIDEALTTAKAIVTEDATVPEAPMAYTIIGSIEASRDRYDDAIKAYEEVLKRQPRAADANLAIASLYVAMGNLDKAQAHAQQASVLLPQNPLVRVTMARIGLARREPRARAELAALQKDYPNAPAVLNLVAAQQAVDRQFDKARATYQKSLQLAPGNLEALTGLSRVDLVSGRGKEAVARVESGLKTTEPTAGLLMMAAQTHAASGDMPRAEALLKQAIELEPARLQAYGMLGGLYIAQNRLDEAKDQFRVLIQKNPKSVPARTMLAMLLEAQKRTAEAEAEYKTVLSIDSRALVAANNLAYIYVASNRNLDEALQLAQTANQVQPDEPHVNDTLGWIYCKKNMGTRAIPHLELSIEKDPSDPAVHYHLGVAYSQDRQIEKAKKHLRQALSMKKDFEGADDARKVLAELGG